MKNNNTTFIATIEASRGECGRSYSLTRLAPIGGVRKRIISALVPTGAPPGEDRRPLPSDGINLAIEVPGHIKEEWLEAEGARFPELSDAEVVSLVAAPVVEMGGVEV